MGHCTQCEPAVIGVPSDYWQAASKLSPNSRPATRKPTSHSTRYSTIGGVTQTGTIPILSYTNHPHTLPYRIRIRKNMVQCRWWMYMYAAALMSALPRIENKSPWRSGWCLAHTHSAICALICSLPLGHQCRCTCR